jgi:hypothetical protein
MILAQRILAGVRALTGVVYFLWALAFLTLAGWLIWPIGGFSWLFDIVGAAIVYCGINCIRRGCEELLLNRPERPSVDTRQKFRR